MNRKEFVDYINRAIVNSYRRKENCVINMSAQASIFGYKLKTLRETLPRDLKKAGYTTSTKNSMVTIYYDNV